MILAPFSHSHYCSRLGFLVEVGKLLERAPGKPFLYGQALLPLLFTKIRDVCFLGLILDSTQRKSRDYS